MSKIVLTHSFSFLCLIRVRRYCAEILYLLFRSYGRRYRQKSLKIFQRYGYTLKGLEALKLINNIQYRLKRTELGGDGLSFPYS
jgi:hypothetical protein